MLFEAVWRAVARATPLTPLEISASSSILGPTSIPYRDVRVAQGGLLKLIFGLNGNRAFATFRTINLPRRGPHSRDCLGIVVHELAHVYQFEVVGSVYIWEALKAQRAEGYGYGGWEQLVEDRKTDKRLKDYNREQQAQLAQDYYSFVMATGPSATDAIRTAYEPFINDLKSGEL